MKQDAGIEMSFQPSLLYRPYELFLLPCPSIVSYIGRHYTCADAYTWSPTDQVAGQAYIPKCYNILCNTTFARSVQNNCILKHDTYIQHVPKQIRNLYFEVTMEMREKGVY